MKKRIISVLCCLLISAAAFSQQITAAGEPAQLDIRSSGENSIRVTLKPLSFKDNFPFTPAVADRKAAGWTARPRARAGSPGYPA